MTEPYYADEQTVIYHGDCLEVIAALDETFDLTFTSPPYNMAGQPWPSLGHWKPGDSAGGKSKWKNGSDGGGGVQYDDHEDSMPWDEYVDWQHRVILSLWGVTTGAVFYNHKPRVIGGRLWMPTELIPEPVTLRQIVVWARAGGMNYNPTAFVPTYEWVMILAHDDWRLASKGVSGLGDVWRVNQEPSDHPAPFPVGLPARAIEATQPSSVLDPFCGSGSTLRAAADAGIRSVGIDKSERYCEMAARRLAQRSLFA